MGGNEVRDFNGFITQDGELISIQDTERVSAIFLKTAVTSRAQAIVRIGNGPGFARRRIA